LSSLLPTSRLLVLVRDGRDVVDSVLDALGPQGWATGLARVEDHPAQRLLFLQDAAQTWVQRMSIAAKALASHAPERGLLVRYEQLLTDTVGELERILSWLGVPVPPALPEHVEKLGFDKISAADKGSGRFHRAATPGLWRQNLSAQEQHAVEDVMAPMLAQLGYELSAPPEGSR
jgi:hypothetical protein